MRGNLPPIVGHTAGILPLFPLEMAARLGEYAGRIFAIDPVDCPFVFLVTPEAGHASVHLVRDAAKAVYDARIAAPLVVLLGMIDGTYDGDALFFSRDLVIEGDTEAVLALRNALEDADLDPSTVLGLPHNLSGPFNRATRRVIDRLRLALDAPEESGPGRPS